MIGASVRQVSTLLVRSYHNITTVRVRWPRRLWAWYRSRGYQNFQIICLEGSKLTYGVQVDLYVLVLIVMILGQLRTSLPLT